MTNNIVLLLEALLVVRSNADKEVLGGHEVHLCAKRELLVICAVLPDFENSLAILLAGINAMIDKTNWCDH